MKESDGPRSPRKHLPAAKLGREKSASQSKSKKKARQQPVEQPSSRGLLAILAGVSALVLIGVVVAIGFLWMRPGAPSQQRNVALESQPGQKTPDGGQIVIHMAKFRRMQGLRPEVDVVLDGKSETVSIDVPRAEWAHWAAMAPGFEFPVREMVVGTLWTKESRRDASGQSFDVNTDYEVIELNPGAPMDQGTRITDGMRGPSGIAQRKVFVPSGKRLIPQLPPGALPAPNPDWQRAVATLELLDKGGPLDEVDERILRLICQPQQVDLAKEAGIPEALFPSFGVQKEIHLPSDDLAPETVARRRLAAAAVMKSRPEFSPRDYLPSIILTLSSDASDMKASALVGDGLKEFPHETIIKVMADMLADPLNHPATTRLIGVWSSREYTAVDSTPLSEVLALETTGPLVTALWTSKGHFSPYGLAATGGARWISPSELLKLGATREAGDRIAILRSLRFIKPEDVSADVVKFAVDQLFRSEWDQSTQTKARVAVLEAFLAFAPHRYPLPDQIMGLVTSQAPVGPLAIQVIAASAQAVPKSLNEVELARHVVRLYELRAEIPTAEGKAAMEAAIDLLDPQGAKAAAVYLDFVTGLRDSGLYPGNYQFGLVAINPAWVGQVVERCRSKQSSKALEDIAVTLIYLFANQNSTMTKTYWDEATVAQAADVLVAASGDPNEQLAVNMLSIASRLNRGPWDPMIDAGVRHVSAKVRAEAARVSLEHLNVPGLQMLLQSGDSYKIEVALKLINVKSARVAKGTLVPLLKTTAASVKQAELKNQLEKSIKFLEARLE